MPKLERLIANGRHLLRRMERALLQRNSPTICLQWNSYVPSLCMVFLRHHRLVPFILRRRTVVQLGIRLLWRQKSNKRLHEGLKHHLQQWRTRSLEVRGCFDNSQFLNYIIGHRRRSSSPRPQTTKCSWPSICGPSQTNRNRVDREMDRPISRNRLLRKIQKSPYLVKLDLTTLN